MEEFENQGIEYRTKNIRQSALVLFAQFDFSDSFHFPILPALSALGKLAEWGSALAKIIIDSQNAKKKLKEDQRHNVTMETIG